ncbi:MAG: DUF4835 family protein, partial [Bacteroidota bacterium]
MNRFYYLIGLLVFSFWSLSAQELTVNVRINTQKLQTVDPAVFETLERTITDFMNNTQWTDQEFAPEERIECNILLTV